jgi:signal transduction histidine kinase
MRVYRTLLVLLAGFLILSKSASGSEAGVSRDSVLNMFSLGQDTFQNDSIDFYFDKAEQLIHEDSVAIFGLLYNRKANLLLNRGMPEESQKSFRKAIDYFKRAGDSLLFYGTMSGLAETFEMKSNFDSSSYYHKNALRYFSKGKVDSLVVLKELEKNEKLYLRTYSYSLSSYAFFLKKYSMYEEAFEKYEKHLHIIEIIGEEEDLAGSYLNAGNFLVFLKRHSDAIEYYKRAEILAKKLNLNRMLRYIYYNIADITFNHLRDYKRSREYASLCLKSELSKNGINDMIHFKSVNIIAISDFERGIKKDYIKEFNEVLQYVRENPGNADMFLKTYKYMAMAYSRRNNKADLDSAKALLKEYEEVLASKHEQKFSDFVAEYKVEMETEQAKEEAERLKKEQETQKRITKYLTIGLIVLFLGAVLLAIASVIQFKMNKEKKIVNDKLIRLSAMKDKFISLIAHDIRGPLAAIISSVDLMQTFGEKVSTAEREKILSEIKESGSNLLTMLSDLLKWMKASTKSLEIKKQEENLLEIVVASERNIKQIAENKNISIKKRIDSSVGVDADFAILNTVIRNLLANAVKFSPADSEVVVRFSTDAGTLKLYVQDEGVGMTIDKLDEIQNGIVKSTPGTNGEIGTGFGLQMCREFIVKHGSELEIESEEGKGTTVSFELELIEEH